MVAECDVSVAEPGSGADYYLAHNSVNLCRFDHVSAGSRFDCKQTDGVNGVWNVNRANKAKQKWKAGALISLSLHYKRSYLYVAKQVYLI